MWDLLICFCLVNATLLINHEIDSAYWQEWELFHLPGAAAGFMLIHLPVVFVVLWGVLLLAKHTLAGVLISLVLAAGGLFAFAIHMYFLKKGRPEFRAWISVCILTATLVVSLVLIGICTYMLGTVLTV